MDEFTSELLLFPFLIFSLMAIGLARNRSAASGLRLGLRLERHDVLGEPDGQDDVRAVLHPGPARPRTLARLGRGMGPLDL